MASSCVRNCYNDVLGLIDKLESNADYSTALYPNRGTDRRMDIYVYFMLVKLMELVNGGTFAVAGTLVTYWFDSRLQWNLTEKNYVNNVEFPSSMLWKPNLLLINAVSKAPISLHASSVSTVDYNGKVTTVIPKIFNATCPIDITLFPFDRQTCTLTIGNLDWGHPSSEAILFQPAINQVDTELFLSGGEFSLIGSNITTGSYFLRNLNFTLPALNVTVTFMRNPNYYLVNVAMPSVILLFSSGLIFFLPSDNNVKIIMACSLLMSFYVLQQAIARVLPTTPTVPLLATGIMIELGLGCYSVLCAVVTVTLRELQPPLCPACVKLVTVVERVLFYAPRASQSNKITVDREMDSYNSNTLAAMQSASITNTRSNRLSGAITTLVQALKTQAERKEAKKLDHVLLNRYWKVMDLILNFFLFFVYLIVAIASCLTYLFGVGV